MDQLGSIFKEARTRINKTLDDASRDTKIAKKYLLAIENEEFDAFPGETYLIGFMRNYAHFLGLDPDDLVQKYKEYKIQEQPAPIEQLTARPRKTGRYALLGVIFAAVAVVAVILGLGGRGEKEDDGKPAKREKGAEQKREAADQKAGKVYLFEDEEMIRDFTKGEVIEVPVRNARYSIRIDETSGKLGFSVGNVPFTASADEKVEIDFDRDGRRDLSLKPNQLGENGATITIKKLYRTDLEGAEAAKARGGRDKPAGPPEVAISKDAAAGGELPVAPKEGFQILSSYEKTDISAAIKTNDTTYLGYALDKEPKKERVLRNGDQLAFTAKDEMKLTVANAQGIGVEINKVPVTLGDRGQVVAKTVRWYRDASNRELFHLMISDIEE